MTDEDILARLVDKSLLVSPDTAEVVSISNRLGKCKLKVRERFSQGTAYRFVTICKEGKKKDIALHRLVWMSVHLTVVPDECDVHHVKGNISDAIWNLELMDSSRNRSIKNTSSGEEFVGDWVA